MPRETHSLADALRGSTQPEPVHRQLRVLAAQDGRTMYCMLAEALNDLFAKRKLPPIAGI